MKKQLFLLSLLTVLGLTSYASFNYGNWRWRNDDGTETTATWKNAENTSIEIGDISSVIRLRMEIAYPINDTGTGTYLYYKTSDNSSLVQISSDASINAFVLVASGNANVTDGMPTTRQLTGNATYGSYTYVAGTLRSSNSYTNYQPVAQQKSEYEFVIKPTANLRPGITYYFYFGSWGSGTAPYLTTPSTLPVKLSSFAVKKTNSTILLTWGTESEINNDRFEIERSADGKKWEVIGSVSGKGQGAYEYQDLNPLAGVNYYRLAQYDKDGTVAYSGVRSAEFALSAAKVSIYPNPTTEMVTITLPSFKGKSVSIKINDLQGRQLDVRLKEVTDQKVEYRLPSVISKGIYLINLKGDGLNHSQKIQVK